MKILYVFNSGKIIGGGELMFLNLIDEIKRSVEAYCVVPSEGEIKTMLDSLGVATFICHFPSVKKAGFLFPIYLVKFLKILKTVKPDIVHINGSRAMLYAGSASKILGLKTVWHVRKIVKDLPLDILLYNLSDIVIANSKATSERFSYFRNAESKVKVVYNGVNIKKFKRSSKDDKREFGIPPNFKVITSIGRLEYAKGFSFFLKAAKHILDRIKNIKFLIVGDGPLKEELVKITEEMRLKDNVVFTGYINRKDITKIYSITDVFVLSSLREDFGNVVIEAMASGIPVVATSAGGVPEIIKNGIDGLLVPPKNPEAIAAACIKLLKNKELYKRISTTAREKIRKYFTITKHSEKIIEIYSKMMKK
mgnify:CR=1 FL=1